MGYFSIFNNPVPSESYTVTKLIDTYARKGALKAKVQLHAHSNKSDGAQSYTDLYTAYKDAGYHMINRTDHNNAEGSSVVSGIICVRGVEESTNEDASHVGIIDVGSSSNVWSQQVGYDGERLLKSIIDFHKNAGRLVTANHPIDSGFDAQIITSNGFDMMEIFNTRHRTSAESLWDSILISGHKIWATATDDCHDVTDPAKFNLGWIEVYVNTLDKVSIIDAIRAGRFVACHQHSIDVDKVMENVITVSSESMAPSNFELIVDGVVVDTVLEADSATFTVDTTNAKYCRIRAVSMFDSSHFAITQPFYIEKTPFDIVGEIQALWREIDKLKSPST